MPSTPSISSPLLGFLPGPGVPCGFYFLLDGGVHREISPEYFLPLSLGFENEFDGVAEGAFAAGVLGGEVGCRFHLGAGVLDSYGQACPAHGWEVDDVVAYESGFVGGDSGLTNDLLESGTFIMTALLNEFQFQVAGAQGNGFRVALRDESGAKPGKTRQGDGDSVVSVKAFELDGALRAQLG